MRAKDTVSAGKKDLSLQQLSHNAPHRPDINWRRNTRGSLLQLTHKKRFNELDSKEKEPHNWINKTQFESAAPFWL